MSRRYSGFLVQSDWGLRGNFEVVTPIAAGGLAHIWRNNDADGLPWSVPYYFGAGFADDVTLIQSSYDSPGNLEVVARYGDRLVHFYRAKDLKWHETVQFASGVSGTPALIESTFGLNAGPHGNFELVAPVATGGLAHWWRDNSVAGEQWHGPTPFGTGTVGAVALFQSNYDSPGNLEVIARVVGRLLVRLDQPVLREHRDVRARGDDPDLPPHVLRRQPGHVDLLRGVRPLDPALRRNQWDRQLEVPGPAVARLNDAGLVRHHVVRVQGGDDRRPVPVEPRVGPAGGQGGNRRGAHFAHDPVGARDLLHRDQDRRVASDRPLDGVGKRDALGLRSRGGGCEREGRGQFPELVHGAFRCAIAAFGPRPRPIGASPEARSGERVVSVVFRTGSVG